MKLKCECGREFEAPDGARQADCPACGRSVRADWLESLDAVDIELEVEEAPPPEPPEPPPEAPPPPTPEEPSPAPQEPEEKEAAGLLGLLRLIRDEPVAVMDLLRVGLRGEKFLVELGIAVAALACVWANAAALLAGGWGVRSVAAHLVRFVVELEAATAMLVLLAVLLKRDREERPHPLGVAEAVALTRLLGLAVAVPAGMVMAEAVALTGGAGHAPAVLLFFAHRVVTLYVAVVFSAQTAYVVGLFNLGCAPSVAISLAVSYAAYSIAGL